MKFRYVRRPGNLSNRGSDIYLPAVCCEEHSKIQHPRPTAACRRFRYSELIEPSWKRGRSASEFRTSITVVDSATTGGLRGAAWVLGSALRITPPSSEVRPIDAFYRLAASRQITAKSGAPDRIPRVGSHGVSLILVRRGYAFPWRKTGKLPGGPRGESDPRILGVAIGN